MIFLKKLVFLFFLITAGKLNAQSRIWGGLVFPVSASWSIKQSGKTIELSNYNMGTPPLFNLTLFDMQPFEGRPDSLFAQAWRGLINKLPKTDFVPRWRRFYTEDGVLIQQGFMEFPAEAGGPLYRQLNVFVLEKGYQACLLEMESVQEYKKIQTDWMERIQGAALVSGKNR